MATYGSAYGSTYGSTYGSYYQTSTPIAVPAKAPQYHYYQPSQQQAYAVSPPEASDSVNSSSGMTPTYGQSAYSATSSSYAGSASGEYDSTYSANGVDLQEYMQDRFSGTFDPLPLDRTLAVQAQTWVAQTCILNLGNLLMKWQIWIIECQAPRTAWVTEIGSAASFQVQSQISGGIPGC